MFLITVAGRPQQSVSAPLGRYPIEALRSNLDSMGSLDPSHPKAHPFYPDRPWVWRPPGFCGLEPISEMLMRRRWVRLRPGESGYGDGEDHFGWTWSHSDHIPVVEYDIRALDDWHVELLMTADGKPSLWRLQAAADIPRHEWRWFRVVEYPSTIEGSFLWMQDPRYVVAERDGQWCVIGPLDASAPDVRPIVEKDADVALYLVEDVYAKKDYFRIGGQLLDGRGLRIGAIDVSESPDDQLREVVAKVVLRRE